MSILIMLLPLSLAPVWVVVWLRRRQLKKHGSIPDHILVITKIHYVACAIYLVYGTYWSSGFKSGFYKGFGDIGISILLLLLSIVSYWFIYFLVKTYSGCFSTGHTECIKNILPASIMLVLYVPSAMFYFTGINLLDMEPEPEIYGVIYDQYNQPVVNANVTYQLWHVRYGKSIAQTSTDSKGLFRISGYKHAEMEILYAEKDGYEFLQSEWSKRVYLNAIMHQPYLDAWTYHSKDNPAVFHAWEIQEMPQLVASNLFLKLDSGKDYSLNMGEHLTHNTSSAQLRKFWGLNLADIFPIDLIFHIEKDGKDHISTQKMWSFSLHVPEGGLVEATDLFMHRAPEEGYQQDWRVSFSKPREQVYDLTDYVEQVKRKFYIKSRNGKLFARVEMEVIPFYGYREPIPSAVRIKYWSNLNGSRNLQIPPEYIPNFIEEKSWYTSSWIKSVVIFVVILLFVVGGIIFLASREYNRGRS